jgi:pyruvate/2-oxoglutarate dehydrogenase complex dihydrolipoamide dehydrogenase (E3) component
VVPGENGLLRSIVDQGGWGTGVRGAIRVERRMRTNLPDVLAAGDV